MSNLLPIELQQLLDRHQIHDCILRYCSAVDRFDREMLLSVYHPDAMDDHGGFVGSAAQFVDWAFAYHAKYQHTHKHYVLNHTAAISMATPHTPRRTGCSRATTSSARPRRSMAGGTSTASRSARAAGPLPRANASSNGAARSATSRSRPKRSPPTPPPASRCATGTTRPTGGR